MSIVLMFMITATVTPFVFIFLKKITLSIIQTVLLIGMWMYYYEAVFNTAPVAFSILWLAFYLSLIVSFVAWAMMIVNMVYTYNDYRRYD